MKNHNMELISPFLKRILDKNKYVGTSCLYCQNKIYKAYIVYAKDIVPHEDSCIFYGLLLCKECVNENEIETKPHITFDCIDFDKKEILFRLKKFGLLL